MLALVVAWFGILSAFLILLRAVQGKILSRYIYFYSYLVSVLIGSPLLILVRMADPSLYPRYYWPIQFATLILGYGVILEIFKHVLSPYPGAERFARFLGIVLFAMILCFALIDTFIAPHSSHVGTFVEVERNLRMVQAILLVGILAVTSRYRISVGRNMNGMILGYGLYIGTSLVSLAVSAYAGTWLTAIWKFAEPIAFTISLLIWLITLWSYIPGPASGSDIRIETDYEALVERTRNTMDTVRSYLAKAVRQ